MVGPWVVASLAGVVLVGWRSRRAAAGRQEALASQLQAQKDQFGAFCDGAPQAVAIQDMDGRVVRVNSAFTRLFGWSTDEVVGGVLDDVVADGDARTDAMAISARVARGESLTVEGVRRDRDGRAIEVMISASPVVSDGRRIATLALYEDISERKRIEEALKQSEQSYRELFEYSSIGIFRTSPAGRFLIANSTMVRMLGYESEAELLAVPVADIYVDPSQRERVLRDAAASGWRGTRGLELDWRRRDGSAVRLRANWRTVFHPDGTPEYFEVMAEDISERHRVEAQRRQAQKLESLGQLTGGLAHDFNNVLAVILANADLLSREQPPVPGGGDVEAIRSAALRGRSMIRKLLAFARQRALERSPLHLGAVVREATEVFRRLIPASIDVQLDIESDLPPVLADPTAVDQIILNLVTNARDAMPEGGQLRVRVSAERDGCPTVWFAVSDSGVGMDEATRQRIFEPFFTTKAADAGTGLGLAVVYGLVKQHGGTIEVDSAPGQGAVFRIGLPACDEAPLTAPVPEASLPQSQTVRAGTTVLVVDDEPQLRAIARRLLEGWGYRVLVAGDGLEALTAIEETNGRLSLVLSDLQMPKLDGLRLHDEARKIGCRAPFVFVSGDGDPTAADQLPAGAAWLAKPWSVDDLQRVVRRSTQGPGESHAPAHR